MTDRELQHIVTEARDAKPGGFGVLSALLQRLNWDAGRIGALLVRRREWRTVRPVMASD